MGKRNLLVVIIFLGMAVTLILNVGCVPKEHWSESKPEEQGMDSTILGQINDHVKEDLSGTTSVLVIRNGYIVFEEYYKGDSNSQRHIFSATQSFTSSLIGIAINEGYIENVDQKMIGFFPEFVSENLNPYIEEITIRHLLTMTSGLNTSKSVKLNPREIKKMLESSDHLLPGDAFFHDGNNSQLLSMIITKATGETLEEYGKKHIFDPLGITQYSWDNVYGYTYGSNAMYLSIRDLAKFGFLYLKEGIWRNKQIVPPEWIEESTQSKLELPQEIQSDSVKDYGYNWWIISTHNYYGYLAAGRSGQYLCVVPDLDLVIVITSEEYTSGGYSFQHLSILNDYVIPAIVE